MKDSPIKVTFIVIDGLTQSDLPDVYQLAKGAGAIAAGHANEVGGHPIESSVARLGPPEAKPVVKAAAAASRAADEVVRAREEKARAADTAASQEPTGPTYCAVCLEEQEDSLGGITCPQGHGGADSLEKAEANVKRAKRDAKLAKKEKAKPAPEPEPEPEDEDEAQDAAAPPPKAKKQALTVPREIAEATKFRKIVDWMKDQGLSSTADIDAACDGLKDQIPYLERVANRTARIAAIVEGDG